MNTNLAPTIARTITNVSLYEIVATSLLDAPRYFREESLAYGIQRATEDCGLSSQRFPEQTVMRTLAIMRACQYIYWSDGYDFLSVNKEIESTVEEDLKERLTPKRLEGLQTFAKAVWQKAREYQH
jgi:hypothetical protein